MLCFHELIPLSLDAGERERVGAREKVVEREGGRHREKERTQ